MRGGLLPARIDGYSCVHTDQKPTVYAGCHQSYTEMKRYSRIEKAQFLNVDDLDKVPVELTGKIM